MSAELQRMKLAKEALAAAFNEASFDLERIWITPGRKSRRITSELVSAAQLRDIYFRQVEQAVATRAELHAPENLISQWVDSLRGILGYFIDPKTDRIGLGFPTERGSSTLTTFRSDGFVDQDFESSLRGFAEALVQAAAIIGVGKTMQLLAEWRRGEPIRFRMCTVLNGLPLSTPVSPRDDVRIVPLALTTTQLPRLPITSDTSPIDYLGLTLLSVELSASPALFRPHSETHEHVVKSRSVNGTNFDLVCDALSLQGNCHVSWSIVWEDYLDAAPLCLRILQNWSRGESRPKRLSWKRKERDSATGAVTITPSDDVAHKCLDQNELHRTLEAVRDTDKRLRIAIDRWRRSKRSGSYARLEDQYIDLRLALESLYLKDFANEYSQEMRFRLALFGAWHLGGSLDERRSIRKTLRDAYDTASKAVHLGEVPEEARAPLSFAQDLCRQGILKLLHEGVPPDWGDLVLGAEAP